MTVLIVALSALVAANWFSRLVEKRWLEWITKPLVTSGLIVIALTLDPANNAQRWWFVVGLILCVFGDIALMLPKEQFLVGLGAFLLGHIAFLVGLIERAEATASWTIALVAVAIAACGLFTARRTLSVLAARGSKLLKPVAIYAAVIFTMAVASLAGGSVTAPMGAVAFSSSDTILADNKFVQTMRWKSVAVMVTYHAALIALVRSLV